MRHRQRVFAATTILVGIALLGIAVFVVGLCRVEDTGPDVVPSWSLPPPFPAFFDGVEANSPMHLWTRSQWRLKTAYWAGRIDREQLTRAAHKCGLQGHSASSYWLTGHPMEIARQLRQPDSIASELERGEVVFFGGSVLGQRPWTASVEIWYDVETKWCLGRARMGYN